MENTLSIVKTKLERYAHTVYGVVNFLFGQKPHIISLFIWSDDGLFMNAHLWRPAALVPFTVSGYWLEKFPGVIITGPPMDAYC